MQYKDPYQNPKLYDIQYWWKKNDLEFWKSLAKSYQAKKILEIGSGTGRVGISLLKDGFNYSGLELSSSFNTHFKAKIRGLGFKVDIYEANYEDFALQKKYDLVLSTFNTFNHCLSKKAFKRMLLSVSNHLIRNGRFVFELFVPDPLALYRSKTTKIDLMEYLCPTSGKLIQIKESINYNHINNIINIKWYYYSSDQIINKIKFKMKAWYPDVIMNMIDGSPFVVEQLLGDYQSNPLTPESKKQIFICKPGF